MRMQEIILERTVPGQRVVVFSETEEAERVRWKQKVLQLIFDPLGLWKEQWWVVRWTKPLVLVQRLFSGIRTLGLQQGSSPNETQIFISFLLRSEFDRPLTLCFHTLLNIDTLTRTTGSTFRSKPRHDGTTIGPSGIIPERSRMVQFVLTSSTMVIESRRQRIVRHTKSFDTLRWRRKLWNTSSQTLPSVSLIKGSLIFDQQPVPSVCLPTLRQRCFRQQGLWVKVLCLAFL